MKEKEIDSIKKQASKLRKELRKKHEGIVKLFNEVSKGFHTVMTDMDNLLKELSGE